MDVILDGSENRYNVKIVLLENNSYKKHILLWTIEWQTF